MLDSGASIMEPERWLKHEHNHRKRVLSKGIDQGCQRDVIQKQPEFDP